ncbi:MAG: Uroporphyrinogen decarboxylase (URO-D) [bacterium ADurb.Bin429]|nr:MAG: Uroporphyrinogen decarboxylase (URO-D) [bacterium ADurb.Bin429]
MRHLSFAELTAATPAQEAVWDALWRGKSIERIAVDVRPNAATCRRVREEFAFELDEGAVKLAGYTERWREELLNSLYALAAQRLMPGDGAPALDVPRWVHGQSQGFADLFGARVEEQPDGNFFPYPLPADPAFIDDLQCRPLETSLYYTAVEWLRYARAATGGALPFRNPVMTGPLDTANYLLGSTTLLEWVYTEPETLHRLLGKITDAIIGMLRALGEAAGGLRHNTEVTCTRGGFGLCSEIRAIISSAIYEEFEAPYLLCIGEALGTFSVHSCGSWERTLPSVLRNPYLRAMNGPSKENDLPTLCALAQGKILLSIYSSVNVHEEYLWPDTESYLRHVLTVTPIEQPLEINLQEDDLPRWQRLHREIRGTKAVLAEPALRM